MNNLGKSRGQRYLPRPGIEPQSPSSQSDAITIRPQRPHRPTEEITQEVAEDNGLMVMASGWGSMGRGL